MRRSFVRNTTLLAAVLVAAFLYACGGGGDNDFVALPQLTWDQGGTWDNVSWAP